MKKKKGFTLVELIAVIAMIGIIGTGVMKFFLSQNKMYYMVKSENQLRDEARLIISAIEEDLRPAKNIQTNEFGIRYEISGKTYGFYKDGRNINKVELNSDGNVINIIHNLTNDCNVFIVKPILNVSDKAEQYKILLELQNKDVKDNFEDIISPRNIVINSDDENGDLSALFSEPVAGIFPKESVLNISGNYNFNGIYFYEDGTKYGQFDKNNKTNPKKIDKVKVKIPKLNLNGSSKTGKICTNSPLEFSTTGTYQYLTNYNGKFDVIICNGDLLIENITDQPANYNSPKKVIVVNGNVTFSRKNPGQNNKNFNVSNLAIMAKSINSDAGATFDTNKILLIATNNFNINCGNLNAGVIDGYNDVIQTIDKIIKRQSL